MKNKNDKIINSKEEEKQYYHIYFNDNKDEIKKYSVSKNDNISKIKIIIDYQINHLLDYLIIAYVLNQCILKIFTEII